MFFDKNIGKYTVADQSTIKETLQKVTAAKSRIVMVVNQNGNLLGAACSLRFDKSKHQSIPDTQAFFNQKWMQQLSDSFWHKQIPINTEIYVMHELPGTQHNAQDLHFDVKKTLKFFLYLNDVTEANGAFSCVPGSHNEREKIRNKYGNEISYDNRHYTMTTCLQ